MKMIVAYSISRGPLCLKMVTFSEREKFSSEKSIKRGQQDILFGEAKELSLREHKYSETF